MHITLLGYRVNVEIILLIGVLYLIVAIHTIVGSCNSNAFVEGLEMIGKKALGGSTAATAVHPGATSVSPGKDLPTQKAVAGLKASASSNLMKKKKAHPASKKEGFTGASYQTAYGPESGLGSSAGLEIVDSSPLSLDAWKQFGRPQHPVHENSQPVPLPEGEMLLLANNEFSPDCCPNVYSNSSGCACMTVKQANWLRERGSNNIPYNEY